jgi:hypothetical protein
VTLVALLLGAALAVVCVIYVARPFLREPQPVDDRLDALDENERRRLAVSEERDRALAALKELEFDHRTGAVSDEDYRAQVGPLRRQAAEALRALEPLAKRPAVREGMPAHPLDEGGSDDRSGSASSAGAGALPRPRHS